MSRVSQITVLETPYVASCYLACQIHPLLSNEWDNYHPILTNLGFGVGGANQCQPLRELFVMMREKINYGTVGRVRELTCRDSPLITTSWRDAGQSRGQVICNFLQLGHLAILFNKHP